MELLIAVTGQPRNPSSGIDVLTARLAPSGAFR